MEKIVKDYNKEIEKIQEDKEAIKELQFISNKQSKILAELRTIEINRKELEIDYARLERRYKLEMKQHFPTWWQKLFSWE